MIRYGVCFIKSKTQIDKSQCFVLLETHVHTLIIASVFVCFLNKHIHPHQTYSPQHKTQTQTQQNNSSYQVLEVGVSLYTNNSLALYHVIAHKPSFLPPPPLSAPAILCVAKSSALLQDWIRVRAKHNNAVAQTYKTVYLMSTSTKLSKTYLFVVQKHLFLVGFTLG